MRSYPAYKDSGVEWLGEVPEGWEVVPLKVPFAIIGGTTPKSDNQDYWDGAIHWITPADLSNLPDQFIRETGRRITDMGLDSCGTTVVAAGAIVLSTRAPIGSIAITAIDACTNQGCRLLATNGGGLSGFFYYVLLSSRERLNLLGRGSTFLELSGDQLGAFRVPLPPLPEQQAIAAFLDREVAKIDGLIEEQRRLIALLAEKRQATISHAVTRGLNPSARLKPSGVDWLGDIPEGWEVVPTGYRYEVQLGRMLNEQRASGENMRPYLRVLDVQWGQINTDDLPMMDFPPDAQDRYRLMTGDLLVNEGGSYVGRSAIWRGDVDECYYQKALHRLRPRDPARDTAEFFYFVMEMATRRSVFVAGGNQTTIDHLTAEQLRAHRFAFPPFVEQIAIAEHLSDVLPEIDSLTKAATSAITLLQERRAALISATVTGKIDVREVAQVPARTSQSLHVSAMVAGVIIARHGQHPGFGRMMVQKFLFMTQACANASEIGGDYERQAAGPLDRDLQNRVETDLEAAGVVRVQQEGGRGSRVQYEFLGDAAALRTELASALGDRMERFDYLSNQLGGLTKNGIEAVATLYAAWNDFLIDGRTPDRADIIREVLENWHPEKSRKFTADELGTWLDWMERQNIVPDGTGPQTQTGRLFP